MPETPPDWSPAQRAFFAEWQLVEAKLKGAAAKLISDYAPKVMATTGFRLSTSVDTLVNETFLQCWSCADDWYSSQKSVFFFARRKMEDKVRQERRKLNRRVRQVTEHQGEPRRGDDEAPSRPLRFRSIPNGQAGDAYSNIHSQLSNPEDRIVLQEFLEFLKDDHPDLISLVHLLILEGAGRQEAADALDLSYDRVGYLRQILKSRIEAYLDGTPVERGSRAKATKS